MFQSSTTHSSTTFAITGVASYKPLAELLDGHDKGDLASTGVRARLLTVGALLYGGSVVRGH